MQSDPSWIKAKCQNPSQIDDLKKRGCNSRVWAWIDEVEMSWRGWAMDKR